METWKATDAKRHFADVMQRAELSPQLVLLRGEPQSVVISYETFTENQQIVGKKSLAQWLAEIQLLHEDEGDIESPARQNRADQFGTDWK